jgi:hypothetical protein
VTEARPASTEARPTDGEGSRPTDPEAGRSEA